MHHPISPNPSASNEAPALSKDRLRQRQDEMLAAVDVGLWYCDLPFDELSWDAKVKEHFWLPPDARVTIDTFYARLHPEDRERTRLAIEHSIASRAPYDIEYRTVAPPELPNAGDIRWIRAIGYTFYDDHDRPVRFDGVTVDVTLQKRLAEMIAAAERREVEATLREETTLVETLHRIGSALAAELDIDRIVQTVTDESTRLTGAQFGAYFYNLINDKGESYTLYAISGVPREHFSRFPMPRNTQVFEPTFRGTGTVRSDDITKDPRYGHNAPHHGMPRGHLPVRSYLAVPVRSHSGEVIGGLFYGHAEPAMFTAHHERLVEGIAGWAALAMDNARLFEAQRRTAADAEAARAEAERANRTKSDFLAAMSHDLRTPLNAIGGYTQLLELGVHGPVSDPQREALGRVRRAQEHLLTLINDILHFARIEAGKLSLEIRDVEVGALVHELADIIEPLASAKAIAFDAPAEMSGVIVRADRERAAQVLLNLLTNAVKFTERGGTVRLTCDADDATVRLTVSDTGRGIADDRLHVIFDPFVQAAAKVSERTQGVGLGLAISRDLALAMGGSLTVESAVGEGSRFTLTLPRA